MTTLRLRLFRLSLPVVLCVLVVTPAQATDSAENLQKMYEAEQAKKAKANKPAPVKKAKPKPVPREEASEKELPRDAVSSPGPAAGAVAEPQMVTIPAGSFQMGAPSSEEGTLDEERPVHWVQVGSFKMGKYEVTRAEFAAFVDETGYSVPGCRFVDGEGKPVEQSSTTLSWQNPGFGLSDRHPVVCVSWEDANAYARWLSQKTGKHYRLPTEAEWEYAARAGTTAARYWGEGESAACGYANVADLTASRETGWRGEVHSCSDGYNRTAPVGSFQPNAFGLYDMLGNVWEWTCTGFTKRYDGTETTCNPGAEGRRVLRGESWDNGPKFVRASLRGEEKPTVALQNIGFRLAQD